MTNPDVSKGTCTPSGVLCVPGFRALLPVVSTGVSSGPMRWLAALTLQRVITEKTLYVLATLSANHYRDP